MEPCPHCNWDETKAARLLELGRLTESENLPGAKKLPAGLRSERTTLEQAWNYHESQCLGRELAPEEVLDDDDELLTWEEALAGVPTAVLIDELERRHLDAGGTLKVFEVSSRGTIQAYEPPGPGEEDGRPVLTYDRMLAIKHGALNPDQDTDQEDDDGRDEVRAWQDDELPGVRPRIGERYLREEDARRRGVTAGHSERPEEADDEAHSPREIGVPRV